MSSFTIAQTATNTGGQDSSDVTFIAANTAGNLIVLWYFGGFNYPGTFPTSVTDDNGNTYSLAGSILIGSPNTASANRVYIATNIKVTPNNPITITVTGATGVPVGSPSLIAVEITPPYSFEIYAACVSEYPATVKGQATFYAGSLASVGTFTQTLTLGASGGNEAGANLGVVLTNPGKDSIYLLADYDYEDSPDTWTTSGTLVAYTQETGTGITYWRTAAVASLAVEMSTEVCGYLPTPPPSLGTQFLVQSIRLTDKNRLKSYKITCIAGATVGNWLTAFKFFTGS
jgi:hypothetical protein